MMQDQYTFEPVQGIFVQDDESTDPATFDYLTHNFGLLPGLNWDQVKARIAQLQAQAPPNTLYKLLFLARHGQGFHNLAAEQYGEDQWDNELAMRYGDGKITWGPDAELTQLGIRQARANHTEWVNQLQAGAPVPGRFYVSPMTRSIDTMKYTWDDIIVWKNRTAGGDDPDDSSALVPGMRRPLVVENLREELHMHTCDQRRTRSFLERRFPGLDIEPGLSEEDQWWHLEPPRETRAQHAERVDKFLQQLFNQDDHTYVSVTSHSGTIRAFLTVLHHRPFDIATGGMIPVLVRATRVDN